MESVWRTTGRAWPVVVLVVLAGCLAAPHAGASQTLGHADYATGGIGCAGDFTYVQPTDGTYGYAAPRDGVITSWTTLGYWDSMKLKIFRPASPSSYTVVAQDGPRPQVFAQTNTFAVRIPVRQGDTIGTYTPSSGFCPGGPNGTHNVGTSAGDPALGSNASFTNQYTGTVPIEANFEDDKDGDGYGDETQDACPISAATAGPCPLPTTLGQTFAPDPSTGTSARTVVVTKQLGYPVSAQDDGVITSWSYRAGANVNGTVKLKMLRPLGANDYRVVGAAQPRTPVANSLNTFATRIPVREADKIGIHANGLQVSSNASSSQNSFATFAGDLATGASATFSPSSSPGRRIDVSAVLEADADGDGFGDTSQDKCPTDPTTQGTCPVTPPPPPGKSAKCTAAEGKLAKAKAKLKKLKKNDAPPKKVKKAKAKVKKAKAGVKKAC